MKPVSGGVKRILVASSIAAAVTLGVGLVVYAGWWLIAVVLGENPQGQYEACDLRINRSVELSSYQLDELFAAGFDCDDSKDICFLHCLKEGGAPDIEGGCDRLCDTI